MERLSEHTFTGPPRNGDPGHTTFFLSAGPSSGTPVILVHGWPERAISWKKVMPALAALGLRVVAPDMRGYGRSTVYKDRNRYSHEEIAQDLLELLDHLGAEKAVWIGHDHGSPAVGNLVAHYPERVLAAGFICIPYMPDCMEVTSLAPLVDRKLYPEDQYEFGQWEYQQYYYENFEQAVAQMDSDPGKIVRMLFRRTGPSALGKVAAFAKVRKEGGFFGGKRGKDLPDVPLDTSVLSEEDYKEYVDGLTRNGFLGPDSYYWCLRRDKEWTKSAKNGGKLLFPVLLVHARYDVVAATIGTRLADPMRASCPDLTEFAVDCGHWVPLERPAECAAAVVGWLAAKVPSLWAGGGLQRL
ncbi:Alpha/Beta hydrolase protein [Hyaloraphidium curvatum]|nr:Alpha/Beta hydrolase protein [Hyaloraphidium curvatum]